MDKAWGLKKNKMTTSVAFSYCSPFHAGIAWHRCKEIPSLRRFVWSIWTTQYHCFILDKRRDVTRITAASDSAVTFYMRDEQHFVNHGVTWQQGSFNVPSMQPMIPLSDRRAVATICKAFFGCFFLLWVSCWLLLVAFESQSKTCCRMSRPCLVVLRCRYYLHCRHRGVSGNRPTSDGLWERGLFVNKTGWLEFISMNLLL